MDITPPSLQKHLVGTYDLPKFASIYFGRAISIDRFGDARRFACAYIGDFGIFFWHGTCVYMHIKGNIWPRYYNIGTYCGMPFDGNREIITLFSFGTPSLSLPYNKKIINILTMLNFNKIYYDIKYRSCINFENVIVNLVNKFLKL